MRNRMEWIECSERLPESDDHVLAFIDNRYIWQSYYRDGIWYCCNSNEFEDIVTHWMPLPEKPK